MKSLIFFLKRQWVCIGIIGITTAYTLLLLASPHLGPTDDFLFLRTLQAGKFILYYSNSFPYYNTIHLGHFQPLGSMEYNLAALFSHTPFAYFFIHVLELILFVCAFRALLRNVIPDNRTRYLIILLLILLPGFTFAWFKLQMNEHNLILLVTLFILGVIRYLKKQKGGLTLLGIFLAANAIIYYKETGFVLIGGFAFFHLLFSLWNKKFRISRHIWRLDLLIALCATLFLVLYAILVLPYGGVLTYGKSAVSPFELTAKLFLNYGFVSDPFLILLVIPLAFSRAMAIIRRKSFPEPLYDGMLFASTLYVLVFFVLKLYGVNYLLPTYPMAILAFFHFWPELKDFLWWKIAAGAVAIILLFESIPLGLHTATYNMYQSRNFDAATSFLADQLHTAQHRSKIFFAGLPSGGGNWNYFIVSEFLQYKGLTPLQFDLAAETRDIMVSSTQPLPIAMPHIALPYSVYTQGQLLAPQSGDYLVVSPLSTDPNNNPDNKSYLKHLESSYSLVFYTTSPFEIPLMTVKELGRSILSWGAPPGSRFLGISRKPPKRESPDFYVFRKN